MVVSGGAGDTSSSYLIRLAPGAAAPSHRHECFEHCYVIAGRHIRGGDYHHAPRESLHDDIRSEGGLLLIVEARRSDSTGAQAGARYDRSRDRRLHSARAAVL